MRQYELEQDKNTCAYDELGRVTGRTVGGAVESVTFDALRLVEAAADAPGMKVGIAHGDDCGLW